MTVEVLIEAFHKRLNELENDSATWHALQADRNALIERGRAAAEYAIAPYVWARAVGDRYNTSELAEVLSITRQAIAERVSNGTLLGLPGRGTRWYPVWQVDVHERTVRPVTARLLRAWRAIEPDVDPLVIATWATTAQDELDAAMPAELIAKGGHDDAIVAAAETAADRRTR